MTAARANKFIPLAVLLSLTLADQANAFCFVDRSRFSAACKRKDTHGGSRSRQDTALALGFDFFNTNRRISDPYLSNNGSDEVLNNGPPSLITSLEGMDAFLDYIGKPDDDRLTVIKFYGSWCKSCAKFGIRYKKLALEEGDRVDHDGNVTPGRVRFAEVEFGANAKLCRSFGIKRLPYIHMYKGKAGRIDDFVCGPKKFGMLIDKVVEYADMPADELELKKALEKGDSLGDELVKELQLEQATNSKETAHGMNATQIYRPSNLNQDPRETSPHGGGGLGLQFNSAQYGLDINNPSASTSMDTFLANAQRINGGTFGRHARSATFSTNLTGRFYKNSTLEAHASRKRRAARMRAKKRELEEAILMEERRAELLEEKLREREEQRRQIQAKRIRSAITIQCLVRKRIAISKADSVRKQIKATKQIACFCQVRYHGGKARERARAKRIQIAQLEREYHASIRIQSLVRSRIARLILAIKKEELRRRKNAAACTIQAVTRMQWCRHKYINMLEEKQRQLYIRQETASTLIQSIHRRNRARIEAERRRLAKKAEESKPKRVPLHMRRYSTYSVSQVAAVVVARSSTGRRRSSVISAGLPIHPRQQRRLSCPDSSNSTRALLQRKQMPPGHGVVTSKNTHKAASSLPLTEKDKTKRTLPPSVEQDNTKDDGADHNASISSRSTTCTGSTTSSKSSISRSSSSSSAQLREARQRAAARVAQKGRQNRRKKNEKEEASLAAKARVAKLEEKRKQMLQKARKAAAKKSKTTANDTCNASTAGADCVEDELVAQGQQQSPRLDPPQSIEEPSLPEDSNPSDDADAAPTSGTCSSEQKAQFICDFEASFDEDVSEREDDLL